MTIDHDPRRCAEKRWTFYAHMAKALSYPDQELVSELLDCSFIAGLLASVDGWACPRVQNTLTNLQNDVDLRADSPENLLLDLEKDYTHMCFASKPRQVYLFESVYKEGKLLQESTFNVARMIYESGLKVEDSFDMPPDHIAVEFELMSYLYFNELQSQKDGYEDKRALSQRLQERMLDEHLRSFAPKVAEGFETYAKTPFYRAMGECIKTPL